MGVLNQPLPLGGLEGQTWTGILSTLECRDSPQEQRRECVQRTLTKKGVRPILVAGEGFFELEQMSDSMMQEYLRLLRTASQQLSVGRFPSTCCRVLLRR